MFKNKNFHFIVPVWGAEFTKLFTDVCLPMILTPENMGLFGKGRGDQFVILTRWDDLLVIQESSSYKRLEKLIQVELILTEGLVDVSNSHATMSECYTMAMRRESVVRGETYFVFLTPDSFWPDGTFRRLAELADQNIQVVMAGGLRVNAEPMSRILKERIEQSPDNPTIPKKELVRLALANFHQQSSSLNWLSKSGFLNVWPSHIYWVNERDQQLIAHCFHLHPLMVLSPKTKIAIGTTIDGEFLDNLHYPLDRYYVDQGEIFAIELSPADRSWGQPLGAPSFIQTVKFSLFYANRRHWHFFGKRIIMNGCPGKPMNPAIEMLASKIVSKIKRYQALAMIIQRLHLHRFVQLVVRRVERIKSQRLRNIIRRLFF
jgi:hypothetical protein